MSSTGAVKTKVSTLLERIEEGSAGLTETYEELVQIAELLGGRESSLPIPSYSPSPTPAEQHFELYPPETEQEKALLAQAVSDMQDAIKTAFDEADFDAFVHIWGSKYRRLGAEDTAVRDAVWAAWETERDKG